MSLYIYKQGEKSVSEQLINYLKELTDLVEEEFSVQKSMILGTDTKPNKIKSVSSIIGSAMYLNVHDFYKYSNYTKEITIEGIQNASKFARNKLEEKFKECEKIHEENIPLIEVNKKIRASIKNIMSSLGIHESYSTFEYPRLSSKNKKEVKHTAGWVEDINRCVKIDDGFSLAKNSYESYSKKIDDYEKTMTKKIIDEKEAKLKEELNQQKTKILSILIARYGLDYNVEDFKLIRSKILQNDPVLDLAFYFKNNVDNKKFYNRKELLIKLDSFQDHKNMQDSYHELIGNLVQKMSNGNTKPLGYDSEMILSWVKDKTLVKDYSTCNSYIKNEK